MHWHLLCYHFISNIPSKSADANVSACVQNTIPSALGTGRNELKASTFCHIPSALSLSMPTPPWQMAYPLQRCPCLRRKQTHKWKCEKSGLCVVWESEREAAACGVIRCVCLCNYTFLVSSGQWESPFAHGVWSRSTEGAWWRSSCFLRTRMPPTTQLCLLQWCCHL